jgi:hypothetical protein
MPIQRSIKLNSRSSLVRADGVTEQSGMYYY